MGPIRRQRHVGVVDFEVSMVVEVPAQPHLGSGFRVQGPGFRVQGSGCRVQVQGSGAGFRVQGSGFRVQGSGFTPRRRIPSGLRAATPAIFLMEK